MVQEFCPRNEIKKLEAEFWDLKQDSGENLAYTNRFHELSLLVPHLVTPLSRAIDKYIGGLPMQIQDTVLGRDPDTLEDAIRLAAQLTDNHVRAGDLTRKGTKKPEKKSIESEAIADSSSKGQKRKAKTFNYVAITPAAPIPQVAPVVYQVTHGQAPPKKPYAGPNPKCNACQYHHPVNAPCRQCTNCGRFGHIANACRSAQRAPIATPAQLPLRRVIQGQACYQCGDPNHIRNACPQLVNTNQTARGRAFNINAY
jgi:hypothetical protein